MMRLKTFLFSFIIFFFSCAKETPENETCESGVSQDVDNNDNTPSFSYPSTPGSYWVYDYFIVDSSGNRTPAWERDTVWLLEDTVIAGLEYQQFLNLDMLSSETRFRREVLEEVVNELGTTIYYNNFFNQQFNEDSLEYSQEDYMYFHSIMRDETDQEVEVPFGSYNCINREGVFYFEDNDILNMCGTTSYIANYYLADGVGEVKQTIAFINQYAQNCSYYERVLVDFYQP